MGIVGLLLAFDGALQVIPTRMGQLVIQVWLTCCLLLWGLDPLNN